MSHSNVRVSLDSYSEAKRVYTRHHGWSGYLSPNSEEPHFLGSFLIGRNVQPLPDLQYLGTMRAQGVWNMIYGYEVGNDVDKIYPLREG